MEWTQRWKDYDVVCRQPKDSPHEMSCELRKRVGEEVLQGKVSFAWASDGKPQLIAFEGNPKLVEELSEFATKKIEVALK